MYHGVHWAMADPGLAVERRLVKRSRQGAKNKVAGLTSHDWNVTECQILNECENMRKAPWVVSTGRRRY